MGGGVGVMGGVVGGGGVGGKFYTSNHTIFYGTFLLLLILLVKLWGNVPICIHLYLNKFEFLTCLNMFHKFGTSCSKCDKIMFEPTRVRPEPDYLAGTGTRTGILVRDNRNLIDI